MSTERVLITGIAGFAGGHLLEQLVEAGIEVMGVSETGTWTEVSPSGVSPSEVSPSEVSPADSPYRQVLNLPWDISKPDGLTSEVFDQIVAFCPTVVYHLAAISVPFLCGATDPTPLAAAVNIDGTQRVIDLVGQLPGRPRLVFVSSSHVYGSPAAIADTAIAGTAIADGATASAVKSESSPLDCRTGYSLSKRAAEQLVLDAVSRNQIDAIIVRPFQHTGPRQRGPLMVPQWLDQIARQADPLVVQTLDAMIDLSDVRDIVRGYRLLAEKGQTGEIYNLGCGCPCTSGQVMNWLLDLISSRLRRSPKIIESAPGVRLNSIADCTKARLLTGWEPQLTLEQTIVDSFNDYLAHFA